MLKLFSEHRMAVLHKYTKALALALSYKDAYTGLHSERVAALVGQFSQVLGLDADHVQALKIAASFHDLGKIGIPDHIISKPGRLDEQEWQVIRQHPIISESILAQIDCDDCRFIAKWVRHHHEHMDGTGYPDGLQGAAIPIESRILSLVDSYDAMAERRAYHPAFSHEKIMAILHEESGRKNDSELLAAFASFIETSPQRQAF